MKRLLNILFAGLLVFNSCQSVFAAPVELDYMETTCDTDAHAQLNYVTNASPALQSYSGSGAGNVTQGTHSLKGEATTGAVNKTLTYTLASPKDLSGKSLARVDEKTSRTGSNLKIGLRHNDIDSYTKLASHFDGANGATAYTDPIAGAATFVGTAQLSTAQYKFGTASLLVDGNLDYVTYPDSASWNFGTGNFTIDMEVRKVDTAQDEFLMGQRDDDNNYWYLAYSGGGLRMRWRYGGVTKGDYVGSTTLAVDTWYHIVFTRNGTNAYIFLNEVPLSLVEYTPFSTNDLGDYAATLNIGSAMEGAGRYYWNGYIDEVRISKGIARWTSNFTPPTRAYGTVTTEITPNQLSADTFQTNFFNLSSVADTDKWNIDQIIFTPINSDEANTFYFDNMFGDTSGQVIMVN